MGALAFCFLMLVSRICVKSFIIDVHVSVSPCFLLVLFSFSEDKAKFAVLGSLSEISRFGL